jgi:hypothetical protein
MPPVSKSPEKIEFIVSYNQIGLSAVNIILNYIGLYYVKRAGFGRGYGNV